MLPYFLKCRKNTESENPKDVNIKNRKITLLSTCAICNSKKSKSIKEKEARELLSTFPPSMRRHSNISYRSRRRGQC